MTAGSLLRAAHRVARRLDYARRPLMQVALAEIGRGSADWRAGRFDRAAIRSALGAVLYVLAGGQYAWAERKLWMCDRRSDAARDAAWRARSG
jgi:hypothetical protein